MTNPSREGEPAGRDGGRCDYCRSRLPGTPFTLTREGTDYAFCTEACREAMLESDRVFTTYRGHRWATTGVEALDAKLPQGLLRNSFILFAAEPRTREAELHAELLWRALRRDELAIVVTFKEPPVSVIECFLTLDWNVLPDLEAGNLHFVDCFTYRVEDRDRMHARMNDWTAHLYDVAEPEITAVKDPTNIAEIENRLDDCTSAKDMADRGVVVIDSLTEFGALVQPVRAYNFVKDVRADICKGRFVPVFAGATYTGDAEQFPHDLAYMMDGIVDLEQNPNIVKDALIKRIRIRKMSGALTYPEWTAYEFTSDEGLVTFDPHREIEKSRDARSDAGSEQGSDES